MTTLAAMRSQFIHGRERRGMSVRTGKIMALRIVDWRLRIVAGGNCADTRGGRELRGGGLGTSTRPSPRPSPGVPGEGERRPFPQLSLGVPGGGVRRRGQAVLM